MAATAPADFLSRHHTVTVPSNGRKKRDGGAGKSPDSPKKKPPMEPEELTLWQERLLVARWGERILRECIQRGVAATAYYQEYQRFLELKGPTFSATQFIKYLVRCSWRLVY